MRVRLELHLHVLQPLAAQRRLSPLSQPSDGAPCVRYYAQLLSISPRRTISHAGVPEAWPVRGTALVETFFQSHASGGATSRAPTALSEETLSVFVMVLGKSPRCGRYAPKRARASAIAHREERRCRGRPNSSAIARIGVHERTRA